MFGTPWGYDSRPVSYAVAFMGVTNNTLEANAALAVYAIITLALSAYTAVKTFKTKSVHSIIGKKRLFWRS